MKHRKYTWAAYYQAAFEKEKKKSALLSEELQAAEQRLQELGEKYGRITGNPVYKTGKMVKKAASGVKKLSEGSARTSAGAGTKRKTVWDALAYDEELLMQKYPYEQWMTQHRTGGAEDPLKTAEALEKIKVLAFATLREADTLENLLEKAGTAEVLLFARDPEELDHQAASVAAKAFEDNKSLWLWYGQEDHVNAAGKRHRPMLKPQWSPESLMGFFYPGSYLAVRREALKGFCLYDIRDPFLRIYDLMLQLSERIGEEKEQGRGRVAMSPQVLYHMKWAGPGEAETTESGLPHFETTVSEDYRLYPSFWGYEKKYAGIKADSLRRRGFIPRVVETCNPDVVQVVPETDPEKGAKEPLVSVVIPSKDHPDLLKQCIGRFLEKTDYVNLEFVIADNGSNQEHRQEIEAYLKELETNEPYKKFRYLYKERKFNFSAMCNDSVDISTGDYILLLNDDVEIIESDWLRILVGQAMLPGTGAVGAKLWYPGEERIQHAGITNMEIGPCHKLVTFPDDRLYYYGQGSVTLNMLAVTAACLLVSRDLYLKAGGLEESMAVAYNDVDFCFKLHDMGYRNVQRNDAVLYHHESYSRGSDESDGKWDRLLTEKERLYERHPDLEDRDPYYGEGLSGHSPEYEVERMYDHENRLCVLRPKELDPVTEKRIPEDPAICPTLERAGIQLKYHQSEPEICMVEGWCYKRGDDNGKYTPRGRYLLLIPGDRQERDQKLPTYRIPLFSRYRYDVEAILPMEQNVALSGFVCRMEKADLKPGNYGLWILYVDEENGYRGKRDLKTTLEIRGNES